MLSDEPARVCQCQEAAGEGKGGQRGGGGEDTDPVGDDAEQRARRALHV